MHTTRLRNCYVHKIGWMNGLTDQYEDDSITILDLDDIIMLLVYTRIHKKGGYTKSTLQSLRFSLDKLQYLLQRFPQFKMPEQTTTVVK